MLNPEFWLDEEVARISPHARLLYMGLWGICDDNYATLPDKQGWIKVQVFPYESVSIPQLLGELEGIGKIISFTKAGQKYWFIKNFLKHQRVEKPSKPKYPMFSKVVGEESGRAPAEEKRREVKRSEVKRREVATPRVAEIIDLFQTINPSYKKFFSNTTQRAAIERMLKDHGFEKLEGLIKVLPETNTKKYMPVITTPLQLEDKMASLLFNLKKESNKGLQSI
jgi:hypothetical protein